MAIATSAASLIERKLHIATYNIVEFKLHISTTLILLNYQLFQNIKLLVNGEFSHLTIILTLPSHVGLNLSLISGGSTYENLTF